MLITNSEKAIRVPEIFVRKFEGEGLNKFTNSVSIISYNNDILYIDQKLHDNTIMMIDKDWEAINEISKIRIFKKWLKLFVLFPICLFQAIYTIIFWSLQESSGNWELINVGGWSMYTSSWRLSFKKNVIDI